MTTNNYRIAVLPGDGIGPEIMQAVLAVLRAVESPALNLAFTRVIAALGGPDNGAERKA